MIKSWADHCSSDSEDEDHHHDRHQQRESGEEAEAAAAAAVVAVDGDGTALTADGNDPSEKETQEDAPEGTQEDEGGADATKEDANFQPREPKVYDFPTEPPFTAFVGNLAFGILDPEELLHELRAAVAQANLETEINFVHARIVMDRKSLDRPRHRGFGYVQVETLEQLQALMQLNTMPDVMLAGRKIQLDTSNNNNNNNHHHRNNQGDHRQSRNHHYNKGGNFGGGGNHDSSIDGSKFRGGRFSRKTGGGGERQDSARDAGGEAALDGTAPGGDAAVPQQRPSLKLTPRTKPVDDSKNSMSQSASNIFGGAKPRDETTWQSRRKSEHDLDQVAAKQHSNRSDGQRGGGEGGRGRSGRFSSGRGGGGRGDQGEGRGGRGGRGSGRGEGRGGGRGDNWNRSSGRGGENKDSSSGAAAPTANTSSQSARNLKVEKGNNKEGKTERRHTVATVKPETVEKDNAPAAPKVTNKFAALDFGDSDSD